MKDDAEFYAHVELINLKNRRIYENRNRSK